LVILPAAVVFAGNGKITGVVKDASSGEPVVGANVVIEGTMMGAAADEKGVYLILNVSPGTYNVIASAVGYARLTIRGVRVGSDQTVTVDFSLSTEAIGLQEVVIEAQARVVDKSQTATKTSIGSGELGNTLPVTSVVEILNTTAGAYKGFIRGGKIFESKTFVNGVDITDQYYAVAADQTSTPFQTYTSVTRQKESQLSTNGSLNFSSVEQLNVNTGAVPAEYSSATAGVINYSLKEARGPLTGGIYFRSSQTSGLKYNGPNIYWNEKIYFDERDTLKARIARRAGGQAGVTQDSAKLTRYTYFPGKYNTNDKPQVEFEGSLGGKITDDWGVYLTGKYFDSHGRLPHERTREANLTLNTNYNLSSGLKLSAFGILTDRGKLFGWKNSTFQDGARFFLEGVPRNDGTDLIGSLKLTHVLSPSTFYEINVSQTNKNNRLGYTDGNGDGYAALDEGGDFVTLSSIDEAKKYISNTDLTKFFRNQDEPASSTNYNFGGNVTVRIARPGFYYENFKNNVTTIKGDLTSQVTYNHQIKAGVQFRLTELDMTRRSSYLGAIDPRKQYNVEIWSIKPTEFGVYLSDRMEYAGLVINLGARLDRWDPKAKEYANFFAPFMTDSAYIDGTKVLDRIPVRGRDVDPYIFFSPRIGVSHPISDEAAMYFSYSRNAQPQPFSRIFINYNDFANISLPNVPSVSQPPIRSTNYELGVQWEFVPRKFGLNFTAYLRDIENYNPTALNVVPRSGPSGVNYNVTSSFGYADSRGVEVSLQALRQTYFDFVTLTGRMNYTYSYIKASALAGLTAAQRTSFSTANGDSARLGGALPFDDLRFYNTIELNVLGSSSTLTGGYDRTHRITYTSSLEFPYDIRVTSVGTFQSGFYYPITLTDTRVVGRELGTAPWNKMVDIRLEKGFTIAGARIGVFADIKNLFNWTNIIGYDNVTSGSPIKWENSVKDGNPDPTGTALRPVGADGSLFYDIPREFYFGVKVDF
jgi:hypothetical protein